MERDSLPNSWLFDFGMHDIIHGNFYNDCDDIASRNANSTSEAVPLLDLTNATDELYVKQLLDVDKPTQSFFWMFKDLFFQLFREMDALEGKLAHEVEETARIEQMLMKCRTASEESIRNLNNMLLDLSVDILELSSKQQVIKKAKEQIFYVFMRAMKDDNYSDEIDDDVENIVIKSLQCVMKSLSSYMEESDTEDKSQVEEVPDEEKQESADEDEEVLNDLPQSEDKDEFDDRGESEGIMESEEECEYEEISCDDEESDYEEESEHGEEESEPDEDESEPDEEESDHNDEPCENDSADDEASADDE